MSTPDMCKLLKACMNKPYVWIIYFFFADVGCPSIVSYMNVGLKLKACMY